MRRLVCLGALLVLLCMAFVVRPSLGSEAKEYAVKRGTEAARENGAPILGLNEWIKVETLSSPILEGDASTKLWEDFLLKGYYSVASVFRVKVESGGRYTVSVRGPAYPGKRSVKLSGDNPLAGVPRLAWPSYQQQLRLRDQLDLSVQSRLPCDYVVRRKTFEISRESEHDWLHVVFISDQVAEKYEIMVQTPAEPDEEVTAAGEMPGCPSFGRSFWGTVASEPIALVYGPGERSVPAVAERTGPGRGQSASGEEPLRDWEMGTGESGKTNLVSDTSAYETEDSEPVVPLSVELPTFERPPRERQSTVLAENRPGVGVEWNVYDAGEELKTTFRATEDFGPWARVMLVPASAPHGNEDETSSYDIDYRLLERRISGELTFRAPLEPGTYELRMYDRDGGDEVSAVSFDVWAPDPGLYLNRSTFLAGDKIPFAFTAWASFGEYAKVVLVPVAAPHGDENEASRNAKAECYISQRTEGSETFLAPVESGQYALRMYDRDGGKEVAAALLTVADYSLPIAQWKDVIGFDPLAFMDQMVAMIDINPVISDEDMASSFSVVPVLTRPENLARKRLGPLYAFNAAPRRGVSICAGQSVRIPFLATDSIDPEELFAEYMEKHRQVQISFGHDVDARGAVLKFAETFAGNLALTGKMKLIQDQIKNSKEFFDNVSAEMGSSDNPDIVDDMMVFGIKVVLDSMSPEELKKLEVKLGKSNVKRKDLIPWAEKISAAGGEASAGAYMEALQTATVGAVDILCPTCATARAGLVAAHEAARAAQAWVEEEMTQEHFELYLTQPEASMTVSGYQQVKQSARRALAKLHEAAGRRPFTDEEVNAFIQGKFKEWKQEKEKREKEVETALRKAKEFYLDLKTHDRDGLMDSLGSTERARVERFCELFLQIRGDLLRYGGKDPFAKLLGGDKIFNSRVFFLVKQYLQFDHNDYGVAFADSLRSLGWIRPVAELDELEQARAKEKIHARLRTINSRKLDALFAYAGLDTGFLDCLCYNYNPGNLHTYFSMEPVNASPHCKDTSNGPCVKEGFGCGRAPLPQEESVWASCESRFGIEQVILNKVLAHRIERRRR